MSPTQPPSPHLSEVQRLAVAASFPCDALPPALDFWMEQLGLGLPTELAPFHQVLQQLLDPGSLLNQNAAGLNIVAVRAADVPRQEFLAALQAHARQARVPVILCFCPGEGPDEPIAIPNVHVIPSARFTEAFGRHDWQFQNPALETFTYNLEFFAALSSLLARQIHALTNPPFKAIALDCDQTLWRGVCAEDAAVIIDPPRRALQEFILKQREAGVLLALCSKNREADALRVLENNPAMLLRRPHLAALRVNWQSKSENLRALAHDLQIAPDRLIFIDDDPVECAEVSAAIPEVLTLRLPPEAAAIPEFLSRVWAFDRAPTTAEDKLRADFHLQNEARQEVLAQAPTLEEFLAKLDLRVSLRAIAPSEYARVAQLTQRTTQFNFTTIHRTEPELKTLLEAGSLQGLIANVRDRFGEYGDVGAALFKFTPDALAIDTFLLSCRALGRGVEHKIWNHLATLARERGLRWVEAKYHPTARNEPAQKFLESAGASTGDTYRIDAQTSLSPAVSSAPTPRPIAAAPAARRRIDYLRIAELHDLALLQSAIQNRKQRWPDARQVEAILLAHPHIQKARVREISGGRLEACVVADPLHSPRLSGHGRFVLPNNLAVVEQSRVETEALYKEIFEQQIYFRHGIQLHDGDCVFDAGANIGFFSLFVQLACPHARIFSFEPAPPIFELLRANARLYAPNARLFNCGVSDAPGRAVLEFHPHVPGSSSYFESGLAPEDVRANLERKLRERVNDSDVSGFADALFPRAVAGQKFETELVPLSAIFDAAGITQVHLLKVDVEKSEMRALQGIRADHWPMIQQVVMEAHSDQLRDDCAQFLENQGFVVQRDLDPNWDWQDSQLSYLYATRLRGPAAPPPSIPSIPTVRLLSGSELRQFVGRKLSGFSAPLDILFLDELPGSDSDLAQPSRQNADLDKSLRPPENPIQLEIAQIWSDLLDRREVGIDENFFDLGGHSLVAVALLGRLHRAFHVQLPLAVIFASPTVQMLSEQIESALINSLDESERLAPDHSAPA